MKRRDFITLLGGAAAFGPLPAWAQQPTRPLVGVLNSASAADWVQPMAGFHAGLGEKGFVEGRNIVIEYRWAEGQVDRMPAMAADLLGRKIAVMLLGGNASGVRAVIKATQTVPIVFTTQTDPVAAGLVASLNRPGGNVTGVTGLGVELAPKLVEILHEMLPKASKFAALVNPTNPIFMRGTVQGAQNAAQRLGLQIVFLNASNQDEIERAFASAVEQGAAALLANESFFESQRERIAELGLRYKLPTTTGGTPQAVMAGVLMSYGADNADFYRQAGIYVGRILQGERPSDLPVMQPTKFDFVINLKTAKAIGLTVPPALLARADEVLE